MVRREVVNLTQKLKIAWAKSDGTSIREHTDKLLENLKLLKSLYGKDIEEACPVGLRSYLWKALEIACEYHDYGKLHCKFQREVVKNKSYPDNKKVEKVRHNLISPVFMEDIEDEFLRDVSALAIIHHHEAEIGDYVADIVERVVKEEFNTSIQPWYRYKRLLRRFEYEALEHLSKGHSKPLEELRSFYILLKGLLLRIDHASSNKDIDRLEVEPIRNVAGVIKDKKGFELNDLQEFVLKNRDKDLLLSAPTGYGKTEAGFIYLEGKGFFTIPVRTSANAIYLRAEELFGDKAGLLHSTALNFLIEENRNDLDGLIVDYEYARNFSKALLVCTPDQLFPFVFAYKGFEKSLAILSYSRIVVDEFQLFEPHTLGFLVEGIKLAKNMRAKVMLMTATVPEFIREDLPGFTEKVFDNPKPRHNLKLISESILSEDALKLIEEKSQEGKVLVILNTVRRAIDLYDALKNRGLKSNLLHSRFIQLQRKQREREIESFFKNENCGIWITTQLAEVSLDLDADFLITEYSTPDSLFQRLGRVNRKGLKEVKEPNAYIFTQDCSGIGGVYRKSIHQYSKEKLREGIWIEQDKRQLLSEIYSRETISQIDPKYMEDYVDAKNYIRAIWNTLGFMSTESRRQAQRLFRDIHSEMVIPTCYRDKVKTFIETYEKSTDKKERIQALNHILDYTFSIPAYMPKANMLERIKGLESFNLYWLKALYDEEKGLAELKEDPEQNLDNVL